MWNILNSIPVAGYVKGVVHYVTGDTEAGNRAMLDSTRSTAVLGAGAVGFVAGPMCAAALGVSAGALWDFAETVATDKPKGLVRDVGNIFETASEGEVPIGGILQTTLTVGGDMLGGLGGASVAESVTKIAGQSAAKSVGKSVGKSAGETILKSASVPSGETFGKSVAQSVGKSVGKSVAIEVTEAAVEVAAVAAKKAATSATRKGSNCSTRDAAKKAKEDLEDSSQSNKPGGSPQKPKPSKDSSKSSSGSVDGSANASGQPPQQNPKKTDPNKQTQPESPWKELFELFDNVQSLDEISIQNVFLFKNLEPHQKSYLKHLLKKIIRKGFLSWVIKTIVKFLNTVESDEINFLNFISLAEFIEQYLEEEAKRQHNRQGNSPGTFIRTKTEIIVNIVSRPILEHDFKDIKRLFQEIRDQIEQFTLPINFRDIFCAVYHYFKHRCVGKYELSVKKYYELIKKNLDIIMATREYRDLLDHGKEVTFKRYYDIYGTRLVIIIKKQGSRIVISTVLFKNGTNKGDKDGDIYINDRKL